MTLKPLIQNVLECDKVCLPLPIVERRIHLYIGLFVIQRRVENGLEVKPRGLTLKSLIKDVSECQVRLPLHSLGNVYINTFVYLSTHSVSICILKDND